MTRPNTQNKKILLLSSGGGHWVELKRLAEAFQGHACEYACVDEIYRTQADGPYHSVSDVTRWEKSKIPFVFWKLLKLMRQIKPDIFVSTGALPGVMGAIAAKAVGAKVVWVESFANAEVLSLSGRLALEIADEFFVQWPSLDATASRLNPNKKAKYVGSVIT